MKKIIIFLFITMLPVLSKTADSKNFPLKAENAYMAAINAVTKLNYNIEELQSKSGYILFSTKAGDEYLIIISDMGNASNIKVERINNSSNLSEVRENIFNQITNELDNPLKRAD